MRYLGYDVCASTIRNILNAHGIVPNPERRLRGDWLQFIDTQQYVTAATDFAQVEIVTPYGLVRQSLLFFMDIGRRKVRLGGIAHNPGDCKKRSNRYKIGYLSTKKLFTACKRQKNGGA